MSPAITRWLSIHSCVIRVLEQYEPLRSFLRLEVFEDPSNITNTILYALDDPKTKIYFEFLSYSLGILISFNPLFQSEKLVLYKMKNEIYNILQTYFTNYIKLSIFKSENIWEIDETDKNIFLNLNEIYIGIAANDSLSQCSPSAKVVILEHCREFYIEAISQIKSRFDFKDDIYTLVDIVNPKITKFFIIVPKKISLI